MKPWLKPTLPSEFSSIPVTLRRGWLGKKAHSLYRKDSGEMCWSLMILMLNNSFANGQTGEGVAHPDSCSTASWIHQKQKQAIRFAATQRKYLGTKAPICCRQEKRCVSSYQVPCSNFSRSQWALFKKKLHCISFLQCPSTQCVTLSFSFRAFGLPSSQAISTMALQCSLGSPIYAARGPAIPDMYFVTVVLEMCFIRPAQQGVENSGAGTRTNCED